MGRELVHSAGEDGSLLGNGDMGIDNGLQNPFPPFLAKNQTVDAGFASSVSMGFKNPAGPAFIHWYTLALHVVATLRGLRDLIVP